MSATIIRGDARRLPLADGTVDLVVTSPPYFSLRSYTDGGEHYAGQVGSEATPQDFLEALWAVTAECVRVLKPGGSIFVNLGDKYAGSGGHNNAGISEKSTLSGNGHTGSVGDAGPTKIKSTRRSAPDRYNQASDGIRAKSLMGLPWRYAIGCIDQLGLILRAEIVWSKPNGLPESVTDRVRRSHETWFHFTKEPRYFAAVDEVRETYSAEASDRRVKYGSTPGVDGLAGLRATGAANHGSGGVSVMGVGAGKENPLGALPGSVQTVATEPLSVPAHLGDHFAAFPSWWPWWLIKGWSPKAVCKGCGFLLGSSYDNGMLGVRQAGRQKPRRGRQQEAGRAKRVLQQDLLKPLERAEPHDDEVPTADDPRLRRGLEAGPPDGTEERLHDGAPLTHGRAPRPDADTGRSRPPSERGPHGQPAREPGADGEDGARQTPEAPAPAVPVSPLRRPDPDVRDPLACPHCGSGSTSPSVILDIFGGTGTTALMADALGRHGISVDLSADYCALADWRIFESGQGARLLAKHEGTRGTVALPQRSHPTLFDHLTKDVPA